VSDRTVETATFSGRTVLVMVLAGVFAFAAFVVLIAYAPDLNRAGNGGGHALSRSAAGYAAFVQLARADGLRVEVARDLRKIPRERLRVLTPEPGMDRGEIRRAMQPAPGERVVVILPKWLTSPDPGHPGWVRREGLIPARALGELFRSGQAPDLAQDEGEAQLRLIPNRSSSFELQAPATAAGKVRQLQTLSGDRYDALLSDGRGRALIGQGTDTGLVVIADPDLFNTVGMKEPARARMAVKVVETLARGEPIVFDLSVNGYGANRNILKLAFEPPFLAATLSAAVAAALVGWHSAYRFGAPRPSGRAMALGKRALADNSAALLRLAGREPHMAAPYARLTLEAARKAAGVPRTLEREPAQAMLDRLGAQAGAPQTASALLAEAEAARDIPALMQAARRLYDFRRRMTRE
jgi:hypothetical protein